MPRRGEHPIHRSRGFIAGAALVAVLVVAGVVVSLGALLGGRNAASGEKDAGNAPRAVKSAAAGGSVCGLTGMDSAGATLTVAPVTRWATVGTMAAPSSPTAGPGRKQSDGLRSCYAHTVAGALFAVANVWAMGSDSRLYRSVLEQNTATGAGRTAALNETVGPSNTGVSSQIAGFKVTSYSPSEATVDIAFQLSSGTQISFPAPVKWQNGDWKIELGADGTPVFRPITLQSLAGYTPWAGTE
jgi:hypothetical protein